MKFIYFLVMLSQIGIWVMIFITLWVFTQLDIVDIALINIAISSVFGVMALIKIDKSGEKNGN
ncbi:Uncharacterised protein [Blautia hydrogenotrophica]|jgi:hypothetical protein|uniref:Uncharacterized protein n=1 Tax=Blautia hydrogenotrophica (strain DSM 10507 / JCM 14656 / S5a33) TaxID=476272 RepID=C0CR02_BLAHS|nr:hypothetical protein RUMHYD_03315 [Blautia hydrogenotrophica DSM 10507]WPX84221.1 hypothetical protein BLHYD_22310 [Blautia hydrogenotrophica DSM 10507]CUM77439.1 Uncharacterised protein [Blautia hydrogenotrophica]SCI35461.1 Uncharacterised protein [uncultured Blautia sp.]DAU19235.1 MAG TPA: hypothetical protein [Caudoviricetes sp.]